MENICGYLMKYTNLVTGWQYRFFVLNNEAGMLEYFVNEQSRAQKPRGTLPLAGAVISPSDEDSHTFTVNAISGEQYKLRGTDAKERQHWVSRLQICTQHHTEALGKMMTQAEGQHRDLIQTIESLPASGGLAPLDRDLLLLKATSTATMNCLNDCFHILQLQQAAQQKCPIPGATIEWLEPKLPLSDPLKNGNTLQSFSTRESSKLPDNCMVQISPESCHLSAEHEDIDPEDEVMDSFVEKEDELGPIEEERSIILHLLSQLKLGMDLTRVVLPTFILEKRSLLEMYADFMSHPDLFVAITDGANPEDRMIRFVEYYLTSFHEGRKGAIAKKPYNPIIGETFHCSWRVPSHKGSSLSSQGSLNKVGLEGGKESSDSYHVRFVAEQVSHHPPVSGFYAECAERRMCVNTHVWTKSKFMGMSIGVSMIGEVMLLLPLLCLQMMTQAEGQHRDLIQTIESLPASGGLAPLDRDLLLLKATSTATMNCLNDCFHILQLQQAAQQKCPIPAEVKHNPTNTVSCRVQGEWNGVLEFSYSNGETKVVDVAKLPVTKKRVRPNEKQGSYESRVKVGYITNHCGKRQEQAFKSNDPRVQYDYSLNDCIRF
ncbi:UNVERIFIED_CONTAM: hypothetical protein FKN15_048915 [Acipenser sinensis]